MKFLYFGFSLVNILDRIITAMNVFFLSYDTETELIPSRTKKAIGKALKPFLETQHVSQM